MTGINLLIALPRQCTVILIQKNAQQDYVGPIQSQANIFYLNNDTIPPPPPTIDLKTTGNGIEPSPIMEPSSISRVFEHVVPTLSHVDLVIYDLPEKKPIKTSQSIVQKPLNSKTTPICLVTILNSTTVSDARNLIGSINGFAPGVRLFVFGKHLKKHQISEIGIWTDTLLTARELDNPEEALSLVKKSCDLAIYIHPVLQLSGESSLKNLEECINRDGCVRARFPNGELAVAAGDQRQELCNKSIKCLKESIKSGDITGICSLKHIYRLPSKPLTDRATDSRPRICIGVPTISFDDIELRRLPIMSTVLTSLWRTIKKNNDSRFWYSLYVGYDEGDKLFDTEDGMREFKETIAARSAGYPFNLITVRFPPMAQDPVYIWNHVFRQGYLDGCSYFFQLVDDIELKTPGWSEVYVDTLAEHVPQNYGMVGHNVGGTLISQPFTHRTHLDIFGTFYPRIFHNWFGDTWLSTIYTNTGGRTAIQSHIVVNTQKFGQKYDACMHEHLWAKEVESAENVLQAWHAVHTSTTRS